MKYTSMKEFLPDWVAALRSGEYKQARNIIRNLDNRFCCLGVAADVLHKAGQCEWTPTEHGALPKFADLTAMGGFLINSESPQWLKDWMSRGSGPTACGPMREGYLVHLNDTLGRDFNEIADWLEKEGA